MIFTAATPSTGTELWRYAAGKITLAADINDTTVDAGGGILLGNSSAPDGLTSFNGALYFTAWEPRRGGELWKYDGVSASRVADIAADANNNIKPNPNSSWPNGLTVVGNNLFFSANGSTTRTNYELWRFDGATVELVADLHPNSGTNQSSHPHELAGHNGALFFAADDGTLGYELWQHSGSTTSLAADLNPGGPESSSFPRELVTVAGKLFFTAFSSGAGYELWSWNGSAASAIDIRAGPASSYPYGLALFNNRLVFAADDGVAGTELWQHDGASASLVSDISAAGASYPKEFTVFGGLLIFAANDGVHGWELWKFDGTAASLVKDLNPSGDSFPEFLHVHEGLLYFSANSPETGYELWAFDGQQIKLAADINLGPGSSFPRHFTSLGSELVMAAASDGNTDWELWAYDPSAAANPPTITGLRREGSSWILAVASETGTRVALQSTSDLQTWTEVDSATSVNGAAALSDGAEGQLRFYRVLQLP